MDGDSYKPVNSEDDAESVDRMNDANAAHDPTVTEEDEAKMSLTGNNQSGGGSNNAKIEFSKANNHDDGHADAKKDPVITIHDMKTSDFSGMNKEELMKYVNDPFWIRLRWILFILFWIVWIAMIVGAVVIVVLAPRCAPPPEREWWQRGTFYQVFVRSFKDSDNDGNGDIKGLISKLDYLKDVGVSTVVLSPVYAADDLRGATNFTDVNDLLGNLQDFDDLVANLKDNDMRVVMDVGATYSSLENPWFKMSSDPDAIGHDQYADYYIWREEIPSTWKSFNEYSSWLYSDKRKQYYLAGSPSYDEPFMNFANEQLRKDIQDALKFWLDRGVDGFRFDFQAVIYESPQQTKEPQILGQEKVGQLLAEWRETIQQYNAEDNNKIMLSGPMDMFHNLGYNNTIKQSLDMPLNRRLILESKNQVNVSKLHASIKTYYEEAGSSNWPTWTTGTYEAKRIASRLGSDMVDLFNMLNLFLKGTPLVYYGEEIGMTDLDGVIQTNEPKTIMQWNSGENGGFSDGQKTWLPINDNKDDINVEAQMKAKKSHLKLFQKLTKLREESALLFGSIEFPVITENIFSALRYHKGVPGYLLAMNMGNNATGVNFAGKGYLPADGIIKFSSSNVDGKLSAENEKISLDNIVLEPKQGVVLTFIPSK